MLFPNLLSVHRGRGFALKAPKAILRTERVSGDAEEFEDLALQRGESGIEGLDEVAIAGERVTLGVMARRRARSNRAVTGSRRAITRCHRTPRGMVGSRPVTSACSMPMVS